MCSLIRPVAVQFCKIFLISCGKAETIDRTESITVVIQEITEIISNLIVDLLLMPESKLSLLTTGQMVN